MANRRMFAKSIVGSARFLRMPVSARLLYYDLGMQADDEGIVEAFPVMRMTGASDDDLRVLASKAFVNVLNEDLVTVIEDWKVNNLIKNDRFTSSIHHGLLEEFRNGTKLEPNWNPNGTQLDTQVRLGKDSIDKVSIVEVMEEEVPPPTHINGYVSSYINLSPTALQELTSFIEDGLTDDVIRWAVDSAIDNNKRTWSYVKAILNRCVEKGLKTIAEVRAAEADRTASKQRQPTTDKWYQQHDYSKTDEQDWFVDPNELLRTMKG